MLFQRLDGAGLLDDDLAKTDLPQRILTADPDDVDLRTAMAMLLQDRGQRDAALAEYDKILRMSPDHLRVRYSRGSLLYRTSYNEAHDDLAYLLEHPRLEELLLESDRFLHAFYYETCVLLHRGETEKALQVALRGLAYARRFTSDEVQGEMHYALARIHADRAESNSELLQMAIGHLLSASRYDRKYLGEDWFKRDPLFRRHRREIEARLPGLDDDFH
jgi:tetratricopeptide (TPR) repeat protein